MLGLNGFWTILKRHFLKKFQKPNAFWIQKRRFWKNYCPFQKENLINKTKLYYPNKINK